MDLPSALDTRESILWLYRSKTERMHAAVHYVLSGVERGERLLTILDEDSQEIVRSLLSRLGGGDVASRHRSLSAESFVERSPVDPSAAVELIRRAASGWNGRPSPRPVRVVVDLHYMLVSLGSDRSATALSRHLAELSAGLPIILLCLLFVEHLPRRGLGTFLESFSRICPAESLVSGPPARQTGSTREHSEKLDAVLNRLVLSDETVLEKAVVAGRVAASDIDARAFLHVSADAILILDSALTVEYASPSLAARAPGGRSCARGTPLAACLSARSYRSAEQAFRGLLASSKAARTSLSARISLTFSVPEQERVFEASVTPLLVYGRGRGFLCVLRDSEGGWDGAMTAAEANHAPVALRPTRRNGQVGSYGARAWRRLPRRIVEGRSVTTREEEILELTLNGSTAKEIAEHLSIAPVTVKKHRANGYRKLGVHDRFELYTLADTGR